MNYFFSLLGKNMEGIAEKSFSGSWHLIFAPIHICSLGLTIVIGGFAKTVFDYRTRSYVDDEDIIASTTNAINTIPEDQMSNLLQRLRFPGHVYKSNSSRELITHLSTDNEKILEERSFEIQKKALLDKLDKSSGIQYVCRPHILKMGYIQQIDTRNYSAQQKLALRNERDKGLNRGLPVYSTSGGPFYSSFTQSSLKLPKKHGFEQSKRDLSAYINNEMNNGKKLFQDILNFFQPQKKDIDIEGSLEQAKSFKVD